MKARAIAAGIAGAVCLAAPLFAAEQPAKTPDADEQLYLERIRRLSGETSGGTGLPTYDTMERVPGVRRHRPLPAARAGQQGVDQTALDAAAAYAEAQNSSTLIVWRDGRIVLERYFGGASADTPLLSRSLAKPLSAIAVGRAIRLGHIRSLDQPVADFITEWRDDPRRSRIRVRHLLDMRSGLLRQSLATGPNDVLNRAYLHPRHDEVLIREYPAPDEPGSVYEYNQAASDLVAILIERATGRRYAEFVGNEVWKPIGARGGEVWVNRAGGVAHSGCCMFAPADSWLRLGILMLEDGRWNSRQLLPPGYTRQMATATPQNEYFGMATFVAGPFTERRGFANPRNVKRLPPGVLHSEPYLAAELTLFDGSHNQVLYMVPGERLAVLRMALASPRRAGTPEWDNSKLPNLLIRGLRRPAGAAPLVPQARPRAVF